MDAQQRLSHPFDRRRAALGRVAERRLVPRDQTGRFGSCADRCPHAWRDLTGYGSVFTTAVWSKRRWRFWSRCTLGENALEPERVERETAPEHVLDGPRRNSDPYDQRHRHRALGSSWARLPANPWRACSAASTVIARMPYCSILMEEPGPDAATWRSKPATRDFARSRSAGVRSAAATMRS